MHVAWLMQMQATYFRSRTAPGLQPASLRLDTFSLVVLITLLQARLLPLLPAGAPEAAWLESASIKDAMWWRVMDRTYGGGMDATGERKGLARRCKPNHARAAALSSASMAAAPGATAFQPLPSPAF